MVDRGGGIAGAAGPSASPDERALVAALGRGDENAFAGLLEKHQASLLRLASMYVPSRAVAEEVVQETWLAVLEGLDRFEGRSSLRTWIFAILVRVARRRGKRERRTIPFSAMRTPADEASEPLVDPERFAPPAHRWAGHWHPQSIPDGWAGIPDERLASRETLEVTHAAIATLPPRQREVMTLRDVEGWSSAEVCAALGISVANQRVLLHRARVRVRQQLTQYLETERG